MELELAALNPEPSPSLQPILLEPPNLRNRSFAWTLLILSSRTVCGTPSSSQVRRPVLAASSLPCYQADDLTLSRSPFTYPRLLLYVGLVYRPSRVRQVYLLRVRHRPCPIPQPPNPPLQPRPGCDRVRVPANDRHQGPHQSRGCHGGDGVWAERRADVLLRVSAYKADGPAVSRADYGCGSSPP